jgi:hypothetical protein
MKLFFTAFLLIFIGNPIFSQTITKDVPSQKSIGEAKEVGIYLEKIPDLDLYFLSYRDAKFTQLDDYKSVTLGSKEVVSNIKKAIVELMNDDSSETITIELEGQSSIVFKKVKALGIANVNGYVTDKGVISVTGYLTKKRLERLFPSELFN